jgi:hypothetical protein
MNIWIKIEAYIACSACNTTRLVQMGQHYTPDVCFYNTYVSSATQ